MADQPRISFEKLAAPGTGTLVVLADASLALGATAAAFGDLVAKAAKTASFKGKPGSTLDLIAPAGSDLARLLVVGVGKPQDMTTNDWLKAGATVAGKLAGAGAVTILAETSAGPASAEQAADLAFGLRLASYAYDKYKTKKKDDAEAPKPAKVGIGCGPTAAAKKAYARREAISDGVLLARDLVNAPPNELGPVEFAKICEELKPLGVEVEVLTEREMKRLGMNALLGVAQGSARPPRLAIMKWNGGKANAAPVAFVGKGVVFDTGGISIKPAQGMEDMKGDMAGAAAVVGVMRALAARKAKANVVGVVGLVENMPDGNAQRPGDIVRSLSGQTIEIINTDAEGRLVLADALWHTKEKFAPAVMINLATLTGAIMVALGAEHAGLFTNDDTLAARLTAAGLATGEKVWRMPLAAEYDKLIDSKFADVKNSAGRNAGAITAAQFLKRFVGETPWAHLDIAGTGFAATNDVSKGWASGYGVRLLDRFVADHYEG